MAVFNAIVKTRATYITTSEITTLKHKVWDHAMESRSLVTFGFSIGELESTGELLEVSDSLWDLVIVEVEVDTLWRCASNPKLAKNEGIKGGGGLLEVLFLHTSASDSDIKPSLTHVGSCSRE